MNAPQRGPRQFRALAVLALAAGGLLLLPSSGVNAAGHNGLSGGLLESIHDLVDVLGQAVRHGDRKEVRQIDHALEDLIRAYEHQQMHHHHHHHHKGGAIHKGMQMAGKDQNASDSSPTATDSSKSNTNKGKGNFGHGMGQVSHWQDDSPRHSRFGGGASEAFKHCQEARDDETSTTPPSSTKTGDTASNKTSKTGVNSGMQTVSAKDGTTTATAGNAVGGKKNTGTATPTAITAKATKDASTTASAAKTGPGIAAASSKTAGNTTTAKGTAKPAGKDNCAAEAKFHHVAAKSNVGTSTPSAAAGNKQIANVGKLATAAKNAVPLAKKATTPTHVATNFAQSGRGVGASVGQHRPGTHTATSVSKKK